MIFRRIRALPSYIRNVPVTFWLLTMLTAYQLNIGLQIAAVRILESRAQLGIATGQQYPQLQTLGGSFTHNELSENSPNSSSLIDSTFGSYQFGFDAAWEVDVGGVTDVA